MKQFVKGQRIRCLEGGSMFGRTGTVWRVRMADDGAWVQMDEDLPIGLAQFPADDSRARHILLYPGLCEELAESTPEEPKA